MSHLKLDDGAGAVDIVVSPAVDLVVPPPEPAVPQVMPKVPPKVVEPVPANAAPKLDWSEVEERERISGIVAGFIACCTIVGLFCGWPVGAVWNFVERLGAAPTNTRPVITISIVLMFLPAFVLWGWQISYPCAKCGRRFNYRLKPWPKVSMTRRCVWCGVKRPFKRVKRVVTEVIVEE